MKNHGFSLSLQRLFTLAADDPYRDLHFIESASDDEERLAPFQFPANWGALAADVLAQAVMAQTVPAQTRPVEENTVPSWLWRSQATGTQPKPRMVEADSRQVFNRIAGAAAAAGWRQHIFTDEAVARHFYDELRYAFAHRIIALPPKLIASLGRDWRYGIAAPAVVEGASVTSSPAIPITNQAIDTIVSGTRDKTLRAGWQQIAERRARAAPTTIRFSDIGADWGGAVPATEAAIDLLACRHNDGTLNIDRLRQATRLLMIVLDLLQPGPVAIGFVNLTSLLVAQAIPYDSEAGRAYAAAVAGIVTAQAFTTSAELAALLGADPAFVAGRDAALRRLRNHRRAAYGESSDYEKVSVLPAPLTLADCPDLAIAAAARAGWDAALAAARAHGLRHLQVTGLDLSPVLTLFMGAATAGIAPLPALVTLVQQDDETFTRLPLPAVAEGLTRLGCATNLIAAVSRQLTGTLSFDPAMRAALMACGFDAAALARIEAYLPQVDDLRLAVTPWIVGEAFCHDAMQIPAAQLKKPGFDLLTELGFNPVALATANAALYGSPTLAGTDLLPPKQLAVFATADSVTPDAQLRLAAAVQGLISGAVGLHLSLSSNLPPDRLEQLVLDAWRRGVKDLRLDYTAVEDLSATAAIAKRPSERAALSQGKAPVLPDRALRLKGKTGYSGPLDKPKGKPSRRGWHG